ncbi:MAG: LUD domain-containing protein [Flavobacteriaceae bacterium]|nr:LUD domain-containing protein [Flavobacteriaceae bacterium]
MSLFKKIFDHIRSDSNAQENERSKYMPEIEIPIDEKFIYNFNKNGGKFLYCENYDEILENYNNILQENNWYDTNVYVTSKQLQKKFSKFNVNYSNNIKQENTSCFLTTCENLIANDGSILISSNQIKEKKLNELPCNFIVFATTSQMVNQIGEGLRKIKNQNSNKIPTNITTIKCFNLEKEKDFMSYGSSSKNLYLLLLEDL